MRCQLLLIEALADLRETVAAGLRDEGHDVWTAASGLQGLRAARALRPDLVILDLNLPDMEGQTVCRILRGLGSTTDIPIVALHGNPDAFSRRFAADCGVAGCLARPFELPELAAMVGAILQRTDRPGVGVGLSETVAALVTV